MTVEEIKRKLDDDSLHASIVPYVTPLFKRIEQLESTVKVLYRERSQLLSELPDDE